MDTIDPEKNIGRKVMPEFNMEDSETKGIQENLGYMDVRNRNKLVHPQSKQNANRSPLENVKNKRSRKLVAQKESIQGM